ncbi:MAG: tetratricopeptide repeat protein [Saprospiraceae bacterium]
MTNHEQLFANQIDSLENELTTATGKERLILLDKLSLDLKRVDVKRAEMLALEGIELAKTLQDSTTLYSIHFNLGSILKQQNRFEEGIDRVISGLNYFKRKEQSKNIGRGNVHLASIYSSKGDYVFADSLAAAALLDLEIAKDTALIASTHNLRGTIQFYSKNFEGAELHYNEALLLSKMIDDTEQVSFLLNNLGMVQKNLTNYPLALEYYFQALELAGDELAKAKAFNNISNVYVKLKDWEPALKYQKKALQIKETLGFPLPIAYSLDNIGVIYRKMHNYGDALESCQKALALKKKMEGEGNAIETTLNNMGNTYFGLGDYESALDYYQQSLDVSLKRNDQKWIDRAYYNIANTKFKAQKYQEAIPLALKSLLFAQERNDLAKRMSRNELLSEIYEAMGDHEKALKYGHSFNLLKDSIYSLNNLRRITELESEKSQKELLTKNEELKQDEQHNSLQIQQYKWLLLGAVLLLLPISFYLFKQKQKTSSKKKERAEKLEAQYLSALQKDNILQDRLDQLEGMILAQSKEGSVSEVPDETTQNHAPTKPLTSMSDFLIENLQTEKDWADFEHYFTRVHADFFKELKTAFPSITPNELNLCALLRLNLLNNEIGEIMAINYDSVRRAQLRLAKKMGMPNNDALRTFLLKL